LDTYSCPNFATTEGELIYTSATINGTFFTERNDTKVTFGAMLGKLQTHFRGIDGKFYNVIKSKSDYGQEKNEVVTNLQQDEIEVFEQQWAENWKSIVNLPPKSVLRTVGKSRRTSTETEDETYYSEYTKSFVKTGPIEVSQKSRQRIIEEQSYNVIEWTEHGRDYVTVETNVDVGESKKIFEQLWAKNWKRSINRGRKCCYG
jgi:hypothetical protein